jgi:hypothetical protein
MSKKEKTLFALTEDFQAMIKMIPKLEAFFKVHNEIAAGYLKYRNNGGTSIPGIEKHLGVKKQPVIPPVKAKKTDKATEIKAPKEETAVKKAKNKVKAKLKV